MSPKWPMLLDLTKDDCKKILRRLELEAYSSMVSAFRAQGDLTKDKRKVLQELCALLGISTERHRAEVRRAVNDEKLATIADLVGGCDIYSEWSIEGRRLVPLLPRLVPQTAFTSVADNAAIITTEQNSQLPLPSTTCNVKVENLPVACAPTSSLSKKLLNGLVDNGDADELPHVPAVEPQGPCQVDSIHLQPDVVSTSVEDSNAENVAVVSSSVNVVTPASNGSFDQAKSVILEVSQNGTKCRKRKRSSSDANSTQTSQISPANCGSGVLTQVSTTKVLTSSSSLLSASVGSRKVSIPIGGTPVQFTLSGTSKLSANSTSGGLPPQKVILVSTSCSNLPSNLLQRSINVPIVKTVTTTGTTSSVLQPLGKSSSLITPISSSLPAPLVLSSGAGSTSGTNSSVMTSATGTGLKIIAQTVPMPAASKLVSKSMGGNIPPIVVVTKTGAMAGSQPGARVVNVIGTQTSAGKLLTSSLTGSSKNPSALVTVAPKGKQAALVKVGPGMSLTSAGGKPNVIVVQKAHVLQHSKSGNTFTIATSSLAGSHTVLKPGSIHSKEDIQQLVVIPKGKSVAAVGQLLANSTGFAMTTDKCLDQSEVGEKKSTVLADLLQAAGILPETGMELEQLSDSAESRPLQTGQESCAEANFELLGEYDGKESFSDKTAVLDGPVVSNVDLTYFKGGELDPTTGLFGPPTSEMNPSSGTSTDASMVRSLGRGKDVASMDVNNQGGAYRYNEGQSMLRRELLAAKNDASKKRVSFMLDVTESLQHQQGMKDSDISVNTKELFPVVERFSGYRGATYSKEDAAVRRKKVLTLKVEDSVAVADTCEPTSTVEQRAYVPEEEHVALDEIGACDEIHFTDGGLTDVVEETVVTTVSTDEHDVICTEVVEENLGVPYAEGCDNENSSCNKLEVSVEQLVLPPEAKVPLDSLHAPIELSTALSEAGVSDNNSESVGDAIKTLSHECVVLPTSCFVPVQTSIKDVIAHSDSLSSGSSVFMVRDSTFSSEKTVARLGEAVDSMHQTLSSDVKGLQSAIIDLQGICEITNVEGTSETLEITGSTEDLDSVESRVAALHGEDIEEYIAKEKLESRRKPRIPGSCSAQSSAASHVMGWTRSATGLLHRVMKFRGSGRTKGKSNITRWFLHPVTSEEAPGYQNIVKNPMDFSTIRRKLERLSYKNIYEFHADMMLVKHNCEAYNPPEHPARQDCQELFAFYHAEYERLLEKWQKTHTLSSPQRKRSS